MAATITVPGVSANEASQRLRAGATTKLIDVRTPIEFREIHADGAVNVPLDRLDAGAMAQEGAELYLICKSGARAGKACEALLSVGAQRVFRIDGGTDAWVAAGLPVVRTQVISLERQVRIAAGSLVLIGAALGYWVHPAFYGLCAFVGAGLVFAGVTNFCGMGMLLARAPWNCTAQK